MEQQIHTLEQRNHQLSRNSKSKKKHAKSIRSNNSRISSLREQKRELERILEALLEFDSLSPNIFSDVKTYDQAFRLGANQIKNGYDTVTHEFIIPPADELTWTTSVISAMQQKTDTKFWDNFWGNLWNLGKGIISESVDMGFNELVTKGVEHVGKATIAFSDKIYNFIDNNYIYMPEIGEAVGQSEKIMKIGEGIAKNSGDILGIVGFGAGMYDDMHNEKKIFGEAVAHNVMGVVIPIIAGKISNPFVGAISSIVYEVAYDNFDNVQNMVDSWGHWIDDAVEMIMEGNRNMGQALQAG